MNIFKYIAILAIIIAGCNGDDNDLCPQLIFLDEVPTRLGLEIMPPNDSYLSRYNELTDSREYTFQFNLLPSPSEYSEDIKLIAPLYRLDYGIILDPINLEIDESDTSQFVSDATDLTDSTQFHPVGLSLCGDSFFTDSFDLYGELGPGSLIIKPKIYIPYGVRNIRICASLTYESPNGKEIVSEVKDFPVSNLGDNTVAKYERYRLNYIRKHIISSGRGLSEVWLKEYDPLSDPKELLYHSRSFLLKSSSIDNIPSQNYPKKLYIPWTDNDGYVHHGSENPLLRGGLALAQFSLESMALYNGSVQNITNLKEAVQLFKYIEESEWIDSNGDKTGFFLRSSWKGDPKEDNLPPPLFASIDEILGMTLGLFYFHKALEQNLVQHNALQPVKERVIELVKRLGTQLSNNNYFIIPPQDENLDVQLPQELHRGATGAHLFEWFLKKGFYSITGEMYDPPEELTIHSSKWQEIENLPISHGADREDDIDNLKHVIKIRLSDMERALLTVKGTGIGMYHSNSELKFWLYGYLLNVPLAKQVKIDMPKYHYWNFAMLVHAFQLGMNTEGMGEKELLFQIELKQEMGKLLAGLIQESPEYTTTINLKELASGYLGFPIDILTVLNSGTFLLRSKVKLNVGTKDSYDDYYANSIAVKYDLASTFDNSNDITNLYIQSIQRSQLTFFPSAPVGERTCCSLGDDPECDPNSVDYLNCYQDDNLDIWSPTNLSGKIIEDHNPDNLIGRSFCWEQTKHVIGGGSPSGLGITSEHILDNLSNGVDVIIEGSGLDFTLPTAILFENQISRNNGDLSDDFLNFIRIIRRSINNRWFPLASNSTVAFRSVDDTNTLPEDEMVWFTREKDLYEPNNLIEDAVSLSANVGVHDMMNIDHSSLYRTFSEEQRKSVPAKYYYLPTDYRRPSCYQEMSTIWNTDDIDYYRPINFNPDLHLTVTVTFDTGDNSYYKIVVDGIKSTSVPEDGIYTISVPPLASHTIMISGGMASYEIAINQE